MTAQGIFDAVQQYAAAELKELRDQVPDLEEENETPQSQWDETTDIASGEPGDEAEELEDRKRTRTDPVRRGGRVASKDAAVRRGAALLG
jgi:hypothetical protein